MHRRNLSLAPTLALVALLMLLLPTAIQAQSVKIVLPERFRLILMSCGKLCRSFAATPFDRVARDSIATKFLAGGDRRRKT